MSNFDLKALGSGQFALRGEMSFATADQILRASQSLFAEQQSIEIDLRDVSDADSAGLALLLEWKAMARARGVDIRYVEIPASLQAIAKTTEVSGLI